MDTSIWVEGKKVRQLVVIFTTLNLLFGVAQADDSLRDRVLIDFNLDAFEDDGCTLFVEGTPQRPNLWAHCCFEHDLRYWFGGTEKDKKFSDVELRECVRDVAGNFWANIIYSGVRIGHLSPVKFKYVWGWGWDPTRDKSPLTKQEMDYVVQKLFELDLDPEFREMFIRKYLQ